MIKQYGMSEHLGPRTFGKREELVFLGREIHEERDYSDKIAEEIDHEVQSLVENAYQRAQEILITHKTKLEEVAKYLMKHESVEGEALKRLLDGEPPAAEPAIPEPEPEPLPPAPATRQPIVQPNPNLSPTMPSQRDVT